MPKRHVDVTHDGESSVSSYLLRRGASYYLRRRVPTDLIEHFGRREFVRALGTKDRREAERFKAEAWLAFERTFDEARRRIGASPELLIEPPLKPAPTMLTLELIDALRIEAAEAQAKGEYPQFMDQQRENLRLAIAKLSGAVPFSEPPWKVEAQRNALQFLASGDGALALGAIRRLNAAAAPADAEREAAAASLALEELVQKWADERRPKARTVGRTKNVVARFTAKTGVAKIGAITKAHVVEFKDSLTKNGSSPANTNAMLNLFKAVLGYGVSNGFLKENPASEIRVAETQRARAKRRDWTPAELNSLFAGPIYGEGARPVGGGGEAAYWLPLIALFSGARLNEIGQAYTDDFQEESYPLPTGGRSSALVFRIVESAERGQAVKTAGSERRFPVHKSLISLGLREYLASLPSGRAFPLIQPSARGELTANWSKWFSRYRKSIPGLGARETPFHGLRHTFKHYARLSGIPDDVGRAVMGHETGSVADTYGGLSYPLYPMIEALDRFVIPDLVLPTAWHGAKKNH